MTSCMTGALSGRWIFIGNALAPYDDSGLLGPDEPGSVDGGRDGPDGVPAAELGIGRGRIRDAIRM